MAEIAQLNHSLAGRYYLEKEIGRGGMAVVFLAQDLKHHRPVALKVMNPGLGSLLGADRFLAEISVTANLQHPNILPLFDSGEVGEHLFYVMPFVEGGSLRARLQQERALPVEDAVHIATCVASALDHAHRHGVVHRDLKPENILLRDGEPMIADFGIALALSRVAGDRMTQSGISLGTPQYMSPEQAAGETALDGRSDLYSLGAVLYEMLCGEPPHSGPTAQALVARVIRDTPRPLRDARPSVPEHVERAVARVLEKHPADRIQTGRAFAEVLSGKLTVSGGRVVSDVASHPLRSMLARSAPWVLAVCAVGAALAIPRRAAQHPPIRFKLELPGMATPPTTLGSVALSPDGRKLAFVAADSAAGAYRIHVRALESIESQVIEGTEGASQLFFSPTGDWIAYYVAPFLWKVPMGGGAAVRIGEVPAMFGASWTRDGEIVVSTGGRLARISEAGGAPRPFTTPDSSVNELSQRWPLVLPDGRTIAYSARGRIADEQRIAFASFDGSTRILDLPGTSPLAVYDDRLIYLSARSPTNERNGLMAIRIDPQRREATGEPVEVEHGVEPRVEGIAVAAVSASGSLVMLTDPEPRSRLVRFEPGVGERTLVESERHYTHPRLSPDGTRLLATMDPPGSAPLELLLWDLRARTEVRALPDPVRGFFPEWSADGRQILFTRVGSQALWRRAADLATPPEPVPGMTGGVDYSLTSDGRRAAIRVNLPRTYSRDLTSRDLDRDTLQHPLVVGPEQAFAPRLSPDGRWVAYFVGDVEQSEVWVAPFPGPGPRYKVSLGRGYGPVWSRDGRVLFYQDRERLIATTLSFATGLEVVRRYEIVGARVDPASGYHANFDVTPDGRAFVFPRRTDAAPSWIFVHGWATSLPAPATRPDD